MKDFLLLMKGEVLGQEYDVKTSQKDKTPQICLNFQQEYISMWAESREIRF